MEDSILFIYSKEMGKLAISEYGGGEEAHGVLGNYYTSYVKKKNN